VLTAERPSTTPGGDVGVAGCRPTDEATKGHRKHREARAEAPARPAGADQATRARSTGRSSEAMATIGGEVTNPHGQEEEHDETERLRHRAAAELAGIGRGGRRRLESPERD
jgi:hypothetical protein